MLTFLIVLGGWILSLCLHEFSHALVAYLGGDSTVRDKGYLTFNPLRYTHPVYSLLLPLLFLVMGGIGLPGGAVYIETWRIRSKRMLSLMSLAGPFANLLVALALALVLKLAPANAGGAWPGLAFLAFLQVSAVILNLIPLPPFDGYGIIEPHLHPATRNQIDRYRGAMIWIVFLALWYLPFVNELFWALVMGISDLLGVPRDLISAGLGQFRFWR